MNRASEKCEKHQHMHNESTRKKIETKNKFEKIMAKNFPNLMKRVNLYI